MSSLLIPSSLRTRGPDETFSVAVQFAARLGPGSVVLLQGPLGAGKTQFVRGVCAGLGLVHLWQVDSPTYTVVNHYDIGSGVDHLDLYRLNGPDDLEEIGFEDMLSSSSIKLIEWPERLSDYPLPKDSILVRFRLLGDEERQIEYQSLEDPL